MRLRQILIAAILAAAASATATAQVCTTIARAVSSDADPSNFRVVGMAWNGSAIGVTKLRTGSSGEIDFALYDSELNRLTPDVVVVPASLKNVIALGSDGVGFALLYEDPLRHMQFQQISSDGNPSGSPVALFGSTVEPDNNELSQLLWNGQEWVFARTTLQNRAKVVRIDGIDAAGNVLYERDMPFLADISATPDIAINGTVTDILWRGLDSDGVSHLYLTVADTSQPTQVLTAAALFGLAPRGVWDGELFDTVVKDETNSELDWFQSDSQRNIVTDLSPLVVASGADIAAGSLVSAGGFLLLSYADSRAGFAQDPGDLHIRRFLPDGTVISDVDLTQAESLPGFGLTSRTILIPDSLSTVSAVAHQNQSNGGWDSYLIKLCPLSVSVDVPQTWRIGQPVTLTAVPSGGIAPYNVAWDFGDGLHASGTSVTHTFNASRTFNVKIHVTDLDGEVADALATITVSDLPPVSIEISVSTPAVERRETRFNAFLSGGITPLVVSWNFGDGTTDDGGGASVGHTYQAAGTYTVTATVTDRAGGSATAEQDLVVRPAHPHAIVRH